MALIYLICQRSGFCSCFKIKILDIPGEMKASDDLQRTILILYGTICANCLDSDLIYSLRAEKNLIVVVPDDFSSNDIENLERTFSISCKVTRGEQRINQILRDLAKCKKWETWKNNVIIYSFGDKIIDFKRF